MGNFSNQSLKQEEGLMAKTKVKVDVKPLADRVVVKPQRGGADARRALHPGHGQREALAG